MDPVIGNFYVVTRNDEDCFEQLSVGFSKYDDAIKFRDSEYHKRTYPYSFIMASIK